MLARMWRKGKPPTLLVGMQAGAATLENSMEAPQKFKNRATLQPRSCTTGYLPQRYRCSEKKGQCTPMFMATLSTIAKMRKEPRCPSIDEGIKKMWCIYTVEYHSAIKKNETLPFAMTWMELEGIMPRETSQSEKGK